MKEFFNILYSHNYFLLLNSSVSALLLLVSKSTLLCLLIYDGFQQVSVFYCAKWDWSQTSSRKYSQGLRSVRRYWTLDLQHLCWGSPKWSELKPFRFPPWFSHAFIFRLSICFLFIPQQPALHCLVICFQFLLRREGSSERRYEILKLKSSYCILIYLVTYSEIII